MLWIIPIVLFLLWVLIGSFNVLYGVTGYWVIYPPNRPPENYWKGIVACYVLGFVGTWLIAFGYIWGYNKETIKNLLKGYKN